MIKTFKKFEYFEHDNSKEWIIGVPSGEALQVSRPGLDSLYREGLIEFTTKYNNIGMYVFEDEFIDLVKRYVPIVVKASPKIEKDVIIMKNNYNQNVIDSILNIVNNFPSEAEIYTQDDTIGITYGDFYIEIDINNGKNSGKYRIVKRLHGQTIDKYNISTDSDLIKRIDQEMKN